MTLIVLTGLLNSKPTLYKIAGKLTNISGFLITKTRLFKYTENFTTKNWKFSDKNSDIFHIPAQNIDRGYSLEQHHRGGSMTSIHNLLLSRNKKNNVYPCKPVLLYKSGV